MNTTTLVPASMSVPSVGHALSVVDEEEGE
jgi:hypothetical protein